MSDQANAASNAGLSPFIGVNHPGYVVTDLAAASAFFVDVLGFEALPRKGTTSNDGDGMHRWFGVDPRAVSTWAFFTLGGNLVELMEWSAPAQSDHRPLNSDHGGRHLALSTSDLDAAVARVRDQPGVIVRDKSENGFVYVTTPFGLEIQLMPPGR